MMMMMMMIKRFVLIVSLIIMAGVGAQGQDKHQHQGQDMHQRQGQQGPHVCLADRYLSKRKRGTNIGHKGKHGIDHSSDHGGELKSMVRGSKNDHYRSGGGGGAYHKQQALEEKGTNTE
jgi:hypothetical protein